MEKDRTLVGRLRAQFLHVNIRQIWQWHSTRATVTSLMIIFFSLYLKLEWNE